jgi:hypothetical protein
MHGVVADATTNYDNGRERGNRRRRALLYLAILSFFLGFLGWGFPIAIHRIAYAATA